MKILITGGAGFIGSHIADRFLALGHQVTVLDNLSMGLKANVPGEAHFIEGDITDGTMLDALCKEHRFEVTVHLAAQMDVRQSVADPMFDLRVNVMGTLNLLQAGIESGLQRFIFASTGGAIYGEQKSFPADESHPTQPVSPYGISKLAAEKYIQFYHSHHGLGYAILRYGNVYGPRQNPHGEAGVVAIFSKKLVRGEAAIINGDGLQTRDYIYVDDVVAANVAALEYEGNLLMNVGTGIETDVVSLYAHLASIAGVDGPAEHGESKPGEQRRSVIDPARGKELAGWEPGVALADGLARTYSWFSAASS